MLLFAPSLVCALQGAFGRAHEAALCVYDDPPNSISYPCNGS